MSLQDKLMFPIFGPHHFPVLLSEIHCSGMELILLLWCSSTVKLEMRNYFLGYLDR